jgi:quercetin dioxygenase-like cupin family protein
MTLRTLISASCVALAIAAALPAASHDAGETVTPHFERAIPNAPGKSLVTLVVDYAPGGASPSHTHAKSAFIFAYVLSGEIESKVNDGPTRIYLAGESWYEAPGATHVISRNASKTKPAKLLAVFVVDTDDKELVTPVKYFRAMSKRIDHNQVAPAPRSHDRHGYRSLVVPRSIRRGGQRFC